MIVDMIDLQVTRQEVQLILDSLAEMPYKVSFQLINKLLEQANDSSSEAQELS